MLPKNIGISEFSGFMHWHSVNVSLAVCYGLVWQYL